MKIDYNQKYKFTSDGAWFKKGSECTVEDGDALWSTQTYETKEYTFEELNSNKQFFQGIFCGIRVCEDNPNENGMGYKAGDEREDGECCGLDEFEVIKRDV